MDIFYTKCKICPYPQINAELNLKRNLEIESGIMTMSTEMRSKLQEAKVIIEQLKWLKNLSENVLGAVEVLG